MSEWMTDSVDTRRPAALRVLLVDADRLVARSYERAIAAADARLRIVGNASSERAALTLVALHDPDVVLVGRPPGGDLPELARRLRAVSSAAVLAVAAGADEVVQGHATGAAGVAYVSGTPDEVAESLYEVGVIAAAFGTAAR